MGPAPPFSQLSFRRFPFKNVYQGPRDDESTNGGCWEKQAVTSPLSLVLLPNLIYVLGKERASPVSTTSSRVAVIPHKELLCIPSLSRPETSRGTGINSLEETRQARTTASPAAHKEEEMMKEAVSGMLQKKDSSGGRDTSRLLPNSKPSSPCCHSTLQRTLLRKSETGPRGLLGAVVQGGRGGQRLEDLEWAVLGISFLLGGVE